MTMIAFFHCRRCLEERPADQSPAEWARLEAGLTERGFQVRCVRHDLNVIHVDYEGATHPADQSAEGDFGESARKH